MTSSWPCTICIYRLKELNSGLKRAAEWLTLYEPDYPEGAFVKHFQADMATRRATHAGSWYTSNGHNLNRELDNWLQRAGPIENKPARAIIGPHAGYRYCGACAAHAYSQIDPTNINRVFILGPSHHYRLNGCAVSDCTKYATPLYDLQVSISMFAWRSQECTSKKKSWKTLYEKRQCISFPTE